MIAAFLPLPVRSSTSEGNSRDDLEKANDAENDYSRQFGPLDEARYQSARWWRNLNRCLSVVGVIIIILVVLRSIHPPSVAFRVNTMQIVLAVVGTRERW
jgi:hypothetical protein